MSTVSPASSRAQCTRPYQAVRKATGSVAAASSDTPAGTGSTAAAGTVVCVAKEPGAKATISSPGRMSATPSPTRTTLPAHSKPRVGPAKPLASMSSPISPCANITSRKFSAAAAISISISPASGARRGSARHTRRSSEPGRCMASRAAVPESEARSGAAGARRTALRPCASSTSSRSPGSPTTARANSLVAASSTTVRSRAISLTSRSGYSFIAVRAKAHSAAAAGEPPSGSPSTSRRRAGEPASAPSRRSSSSARASSIAAASEAASAPGAGRHTSTAPLRTVGDDRSGSST